MGFQEKKINGFRKLNADEVSNVSGGFDILVIGNPLAPPGFGGGGGSGLQGGGIENPGGGDTHVSLDPEGGAGGYGNDHCNNNQQGEPSANEAADTAGEIVKGDASVGPPNSLTSPSGRDWTQVEFGALIAQNPDGSFAILNNNVFTSDHPNRVAIQLPSDQATTDIQGFWHNHPSGGDSYTSANFYPSDGTAGTMNDWAILQALKDAIAPNDPNYDPSVWVMGADGITREFKLSQRAFYENLTEAQKENGVGLPGASGENNGNGGC